MEIVASFNAERAQIFSRAKPETPPHRPLTTPETMLARAEARRHRDAGPAPTKTPERDPSSDLLLQNAALAAVVTAAVLNESPPATPGCVPQTDSGSSAASPNTCSAPVSDYGTSSGGGFDGGGGGVSFAPQML